jgi:hypothetical protein
MVALTATGCVNQFGSSELEHGHEHSEMTSSFDELATWSQEGDWLVSPNLDTPEGASRVGALITLVGPGAMPVVQARALDGGETLGEWTDLVATWSEEDHHVATAELGGVGDGAQLRVRVSDAPSIQILRWTAVIPDLPDPDASDDPDAELGLATDALRRELTGLGIVTRSAWGARPTRCSSGDSRKTRMAIHHTVTGSTDPARQLRGIQRFHMDTRGWCDVGYHFLIGTNGTIYEGRPLHLLGTHVGGHNSGNIGISMIGCFHTSGCSGLGPTTPTDAMIRSAGRLVGTLSRLYSIPVDSGRVRGHRDHSGQSTSCPGNNVHSRLGTIRSIGQTQTLSSGTTPTPPPPSGSTGGSCTHTYGGRYANGACSASYQCCNGTWRSGTGSCGSCVCTETSGRTGCSAPSAPSGPPPGASCTHTYGGRYANTACSASYQCCNGTWRSGTGSCGACYCTETSGRTGCGL